MTTRSGASYAETLLTVDDEGKLVELPIDSATDRLAQAYEAHGAYLKAIKELELKIGKIMRQKPEEPGMAAANIEKMCALDDEKLGLMEVATKLWTATQQAEEIISSRERERRKRKEAERKEQESVRRREEEDRRLRQQKEKEDRERQEREENEEIERTKHEKTREADRLSDYEERIRRLEKILGNTSFFKSGWKMSRSPSPKHEMKKPESKKMRDSATQTDSDGSRDSSPVARLAKKSHRSRERHVNLEKEIPANTHIPSMHNFTKYSVPEFLPKFLGDEDDPQRFVDDFNSVLDCLDEETGSRAVFWFKARVKVPTCAWDAGLSPKKDPLEKYQKAFLQYFWSEGMQTIAIENFENAWFNYKSRIPINRQVLDWYSRVKRITTDPVCDRKFKKEVVRKLPCSLQGFFVCDSDRTIDEFALKVSRGPK